MAANSFSGLIKERKSVVYSGSLKKTSDISKTNWTELTDMRNSLARKTEWEYFALMNCIKDLVWNLQMATNYDKYLNKMREYNGQNII